MYVRFLGSSFIVLSYLFIFCGFLSEINLDNDDDVQHRCTGRELSVRTKATFYFRGISLVFGQWLGSGLKFRFNSISF